MKVMVLDGNSLVYRAFFALPDTMVTSRGEITNAIFGFCSMFVTLVKDHDPDALVVVFDRKEKTFRHEAAPEYKAQREKQPDSLYQQLDFVKNELLVAAGVATLDIAGFEGDDIIATVAASIAPGDELLIVTGDRDAYQLVSDPNIRVLYNKRGVSDYALYDEAGIKERTGVTPAQYAEYAALRGDPSDNLDGVPGVGEKTAAKLINKYETIAAVFEHADEQTPKLSAALHESRERVLRNAQLMILRKDVPVTLRQADWVPQPDEAALRAVFTRLEFSTMAARWKPLFTKFGGTTTRSAPVATSESPGVGAPTTTPDARAPIAVVVDSVDASQAVALLSDAAPLGLAVAWAGEPGRSAIQALLISNGHEVNGSITCASISAEVLADKQVRDALLRHSDVVMHDARNAMRGLLDIDIDLVRLAYDTAIAAYLADSSSGSYDVATVARRWLGREIAVNGAAPTGQLNFAADTDDLSVQSAASEAAVALLCRQPLQAELASVQLTGLYAATELPLVRVLAKMEHVGIAVDAQRLTTLAADLQQRSTKLVATLHGLAGKEFNVNSTQQLATVLFQERGLTGGKKTKTKKAPSTDAASLEKLRGEWPEFIDALLEYREVEKLRSTYAQGLLATIAPDQRIHASFNQTVARTGRLSSDQPNLHNIPVRNEAGRVFREVFVPRPRNEFLVADYNQIELRCIAHLSKDPGLLQAFKDGVDVHCVTAAQVFGIDVAAVTSDQRGTAKMVAYGLAYGMEAYGLSQRLAIDVGAAREILNAYFAAFPQVKRYMDEAVATAKRDGYTTTLFGRRRNIEGIHSPIRQVEAGATRMAMNAGIQGLAADIFKMALVAIDHQLEQGGFTSRLVLQVHDEVIVEVATPERDRVGELVLTAMHDAAQLDVPLVVNASWGASWAAAKVA